MKNSSVWRPRITVSDTTQRRLWENLRDLRDLSEETSLINLLRDVSEICKSALFEMSLRRCMRRLRDASEMHSCRLELYLFFTDLCFLFSFHQIVGKSFNFLNHVLQGNEFFVIGSNFAIFLSFFLYSFWAIAWERIDAY